MNNANKSVCAAIAIALSVSTAWSAAAHTRSSASTSANAAALQDPDIHTIKDTGLQFELPKGWKAETEANGQIFVSFEDGAASVTFVVEDKYEEAITGMKSGLKEQLTEFKSDGEPKTDTHHGLTHISESGSGLLKGAKITWSIDVLKATKNVTILTFGIDTILEAHGAEYAKFVNSIQKI